MVEKPFVTKINSMDILAVTIVAKKVMERSYVYVIALAVFQKSTEFKLFGSI